MRQFAHKLKENKKSFWFQSAVYFDTETNGYQPEITEQHQTLNFGYAQYVSYRRSNTKNRRAETLYFDDCNTFNTWLESKTTKSRKLCVFASNIWFDMRITGCDMYLLHNGWTNTRIYQQGLVTIITFRKEKARIDFLSLQNFIPASIKQIGLLIDKPKHEVDLANDSQDKIQKYCLRDVEILRGGIEHWKQICGNNDFGNFGITLSSQAFNAYRHKHMQHAIFIHDSDTAQQIERESYFGGRTECFFVGAVKEAPVYKLDINSMYPDVMRNNLFPTKLIGFFGNVSVNELNQTLQNNLVIARCQVRLHDPVVAHRRDNHTIFPIGTFTGCFCTRSLKEIQKNGDILNVYEGCVYTGGKIFEGYVDDLINLKIHAEKADNYLERTVYKLILNSLYGKFGQKQTELVYEYDTPLEFTRNETVLHADDQQFYRVVAYAGKERWYTRTEENAFNSFTAIASHVTDYARQNLWDSICQAGIENCYYCDTDSLFVNQEGFDRLQSVIDPVCLGKWKLEATTDDCILYGPKWYEFGAEAKCKGVSKNAVKTGTNQYKQQYFPSFKSSLSDGIEPGYTVKTTEKTLSTVYQKGIIDESGVVFPFCLPDVV